MSYTNLDNGDDNDNNKTTYGRWTLSVPPRNNNNNEEPAPLKAIVVLIGWWGSKPKHLEKYAQSLYKDWNCATLYGTAHSRHILLKKDDALLDFAKEGLQALSDFLQNRHARLPVIFHLFSNGGGFVWQHVQDLLDNYNRLFSSMTSIDTEDTPLHCNTNFYAIRRNTCGIIYDSCPGYPTWKSGRAALEASLGPSTSVVVKWFLIAFLYLMYLVEEVWNVLVAAATSIGKGRQQQPTDEHEQQHEQQQLLSPSSSSSNYDSKKSVHPQHRLITNWWNVLLESDVCDQEAFIYSTADPVTETPYLKEFIAHRQRRRGATVKVLEFDDTNHVMHYKTHPQEYTEFVHKFITDSIEQHQSIIIDS